MQHNSDFQEIYNQLQKDIKVEAPSGIEQNIIARININKSKKKYRFKQSIMAISGVAAALIMFFSLINTNKTDEITAQDIALVENALSKVGNSLNLGKPKQTFTFVYKTDDRVIIINKN